MLSMENYLLLGDMCKSFDRNQWICGIPKVRTRSIKFKDSKKLFVLSQIKLSNKLYSNFIYDTHDLLLSSEDLSSLSKDLSLLYEDLSLLSRNLLLSSQDLSLLSEDL